MLRLLKLDAILLPVIVGIGTATAVVVVAVVVRAVLRRRVRLVGIVGIWLVLSIVVVPFVVVGCPARSTIRLQACATTTTRSYAAGIE